MDKKEFLFSKDFILFAEKSKRCYPAYVRCPNCKELTAVPEYMEKHDTLTCINCDHIFKNHYKV